MSSEITLKYWNGRGLMETPRIMLAIAGKAPGAGYTDERANGTADAGDSFNCNLGRMPVLSCDLGDIGQSAAINFFVASECGLMGSNTFETAQIISFAEHLKELSDSYRKLVPYGTEPSEENVTKFFDSNEATDFTGPSDMGKRNERFLKWYLGRLSVIVGEGFAVGGKLSLADVQIFCMFGDNLSAAECDLPAHRIECFGSKARTDAALAEFPKIKAIVENVANHDKVKHWLATRGKQGF